MTSAKDLAVVLIIDTPIIHQREHILRERRLDVGSRLAVKSSEIAIYFGEQFKELWKDFLIGKK